MSESFKRYGKHEPSIEELAEQVVASLPEENKSELDGDDGLFDGLSRAQVEHLAQMLAEGFSEDQLRAQSAQFKKGKNSVEVQAPNKEREERVDVLGMSEMELIEYVRNVSGPTEFFNSVDFLDQDESERVSDIFDSDMQHEQKVKAVVEIVQGAKEKNEIAA